MLLPGGNPRAQFGFRIQGVDQGFRDVEKRPVHGLDAQVPLDFPGNVNRLAVVENRGSHSL